MDSQRLAEEQVLVERAKSDEQAFVELYNFYFPKIFGFVYKRVGHKETAEDLVSKTFLKAFSSLPKYRDQNCPFGAWLYKIAGNNIVDHLRSASHRRDVELEQFDEVKQPQSSADQLPDFEYDKKLIGEIILSLPEKYRQAVHLKFFADLSNQEIAKILGVSPGNAGVIIYRALKLANKVYIKKCGAKNELKIFILF